MKQTRFYVNGYLYNLGELLSYEISKQDFDKIYNAQLESPDDENIIVSLEANKVDLEEMLLVTSITITPLEDEEYMFKTYDLSTVGDYTIGFKGENVDVEFRIDRKLDTYIDKIYDVLKSWAAYEDFAYALDNKNDRLFQNGARIDASYGIIDNVIRGKVENLGYGTECGYTHRSYNKYGVQIELDICNRYLNDLNIEEILNSLASDIDTNIPPLVDTLK